MENHHPTASRLECANFSKAPWTASLLRLEYSLTGPSRVKSAWGLRGWYRNAVELPEIAATGQERGHLTGQKPSIIVCLFDSCLCRGVSARAKLEILG